MNSCHLEGVISVLASLWFRPTIVDDLILYSLVKLKLCLFSSFSPDRVGRWAFPWRRRQRRCDRQRILSSSQGIRGRLRIQRLHEIEWKEQLIICARTSTIDWIHDIEWEKLLTKSAKFKVQLFSKKITNLTVHETKANYYVCIMN
jgi:hypothetical protein